MKPKILVVDDEPHIVNLLKLNLEHKYNVLEAYSGSEALLLAKKHKPKLIALDIMMPEMDGYEVCKKIKSNLDLKHIPVVFLSARVESIDKLKAVEFGASDYLTKPFERSDLLTTIESNILN